ncbi:TVP38/TMEM64 family protein [Neobacillus massiliamazoniensis]|uniref:TVP38/TMEM64 family membrane protein n=1 Tax=Neobacillus massiliamazoniensis TaxID=1499688 RepID=A0A0U1NST5_9BACI|nr:TVP38/TMEM64 family protein [Neobacillus massiliamazoniensis]CRK81015.1 YqeD [Neobacillus massiliamazoniensis]
MLKRILSVCIFLIIIAIGYMQKDVLLHLINEGGTFSVFISMIFVAICVFFPIIPFTVLAGIIGAVFGVVHGIMISLAGAMIGTMSFFFLMRYSFRDFAQEKLMKYPKASVFDQFMERNSFIAILTCRLLPVIPAQIFNMVCGVSRVKWMTFFIASMIGKIPNIFVLTYAGASFTSNKFFSLGMYGLYLFVIFSIAFVIFYRKTLKN